MPGNEGKSHPRVLAGTRSGKASMMVAMVAKYAEQHPLGSARRWGNALVLSPGPPVIKGQIIRAEIEPPRD
jgi:hypothetical protein